MADAWRLSGRTLLETIEQFGERPALGLRGEFGLRWWSFGRLAREARRFAALLRGWKIGQGERVLLWAPNCPEWVACLAGAMIEGVVVVPLDEHSPREFMLQVAAQTSPRRVFHAQALDADFFGLPCHCLEELFAEPARDGVTVVPETDPDSTAVILYTSGTTAEPRGVVLTYANLQAQIESFRQWRWLLRLISARMLVVAPLSHVQGLILGAMIPMSVGLSIVFVHSVEPAHLLRTIRDNDIQVFSTVPRVLRELTAALEQQPYGRRTLGQRLENETRGWMRRHLLFTALNRAVGWRFWIVFVGGAALARSDEQFWRDTGRFVVQGYGLTETTAIVAVNGPFSRHVGSVGKPLKHVTVSIAADGEALVKGAAVSPGYFGSSGPHDGNGGFLHTGDLLRADARGRLYFLGRKKDVIVTGEGFNVFPSDVEAVLNRHPGVCESVVLGREEGGCEEVHAVLLVAPGADAAGIVHAANRQLSEPQRIRSWTVWPEVDFPRSSLLKVRREMVAEAVREARTTRQDSAPEGEVTLAAIAAEADGGRRIELLADYLCAAPPGALASNGARLRADWGLSSLDFVRLLGALERRKKRLFDGAALHADPTVADLHSWATDPGAITQAKGRLPSRQPAWADTILAHAARFVVRPAVTGSWRALCHRCAPVWRGDPKALRPPFVLAAAPHMHWLDAFAITATLPARLANRLLVVTNRDFSEFFDPPHGTPFRERFAVGAGYFFLLPFTYPFTIVPHFGNTREGLLETARWIDKGYCPLVFPKGIHYGVVDAARHDPGMALLASECGIPVVPVWLSGNSALGWQPRLRPGRVEVVFGSPVSAGPSKSPESLIEELEASWLDLSSTAAA
jgi:long-chain acyl-CoA synthetase